MMDRIDALRKEFKSAIAQATLVRDVEAIRLKFTGRKGSVPELMKELKDCSIDEKREFGPKLNDFRQEIEAAIATRAKELVDGAEKAKASAIENFDVSARVPSSRKKGTTHPYSQIVERVENTFLSMGYSIFDGPEIEDDYHNFGALNIPENHPARDMHDTLWLNRRSHLLRTHTSTIQIHAMESRKLPIAGIAPGRTFRHEAVDASHDVMFWQCEGLFIDKGITMSHLFGTAKAFLSSFFDTDDIDIRIRPGYFPFVEPGVEIDMRCVFCKDGCSVCKKSKWVEVFPGGMVHPNVLKSAGIDPEVYSGFAFGFGLSRLVMLMHGISDIRLLSSGKIPFLRQF